MGNWNRFYDFLEESDPAQGAGAMRSELRAAGADVDRMSGAIAAIVRERGGKGPAWLARAREAQRGFEATLAGKRDWLSSRFKDGKELLEAVGSGKLGPAMQNHALVFFRGKDLSGASDEDLRSFLDDCELLGLIDAESKERK